MSEIILNIVAGLSLSAIASTLITIIKWLLNKKQNKITIKSSGKEIKLNLLNAEILLNQIKQNLGPPYIFLSYSSKDKPFVKKLTDDLKKNGIRVWYDEYEIKIGDDLLERIKEGLKNSAYYGVVLSNSYLNSAWASKELQIMLYQEKIQNSKKILPILIENVELPHFLQNRVYADFTKSYEEGLNALIKKLKSE